MRTDGGREVERPRGAVFGPLALLLAAVVTGFGMWHVLMRDGGPPAASVSDRLVHGTPR